MCVEIDSRLFFKNCFVLFNVDVIVNVLNMLPFCEKLLNNISIIVLQTYLEYKRKWFLFPFFFQKLLQDISEWICCRLRNHMVFN